MSYSIKNFFTDVNKSWLSKSKILSNDKSISYYNLIDDEIKEKLKNIISLERGKDNKFGKLIESIYTGHTNDMNVLQLFVESMIQFTNHKELLRVIGILNLYNIRSPISLNFDVDMKNTSRYVVYVSEPELGLQKKAYEMDNSADKNTVKIYKNYLNKFGADVNFKSLATEFFEIEREISKLYLEPEEEDNIEIQYNPLTFKNLNDQFSHIDFEILFDACKISGDTQKSTIYVVNNIKYLHKINTYFKTKSLDFWRIWIKSCIYMALHLLLPQNIRNSHFEFYMKFLQGQKKEISNDEYAIRICREIAPDVIGKLFIESDLSKFQKIREGATKIVHLVKKIAKERISNLSWMSESSRIIAKYKLDCMKIKIAYPDVWYDSLKDIYIEKDQFLLNILNITKNDSLNEIKKLTKLGDKEKRFWDSPCFEVNAFYYSQLNEICIPLGFLYSPFYSEDLNFPQIVAGLGNIVGHEIFHGFDKDGRKFDERGNNFPWWTRLDSTLYQKETQKIIELFNNEQFYGLQVNGKLTLDENIADFGALAICMDMLEEHSRKMNSSDRKKILREFFIWYSKTWAYKSTIAYRKEAIKTNVHAPAELRVNTLLPHFAQFYEAFDFDEGHEGFIPVFKRVHIWG